MPLFLDVHHRIDGATAEGVASAHQLDLQAQDQYGARMLRYWLDETTGRVSCLVEAPNKEAVNQVHGSSHGLLADEVFEVIEGS